MKRMVREAKKLVRAWEPHVKWRDTVWHVRNVLPYREAQGGHRFLLFTKPGSLRRNDRVPLPPLYADFAKALTVLYWSQRRCRNERLSSFLHCVRLIVMELLNQKIL